MSSSSAIEWTDATWNPVTGCSKVSPGCAHCYAETFAERWRGTPGHPYEQGFDLKLWPERLEMPLRWRKPRMVFVNSMSDLFHEDIPEHFIHDVFEVMARCPQHTFQVLTKRPERMVELLTGTDHPTFCELLSWHGNGGSVDRLPPNIWLGVSIENRRFVHRADLLRQAPAAVRFISAEPLLGPLLGERPPHEVRDCNAMAGGKWADGFIGPELNLRGIHWLIVGGESGAEHRPIRAEWARELRDYATAAGTAFFFKQWGGLRPKSGGRLLDGRTWDEMPTTPVQAAQGQLL